MTSAVERLVITNFLGIEYADIEIKPFNVLIGPQASGKSVVAKLLSFFGYVGGSFVYAVHPGSKLADWELHMGQYFAEMFPPYSWQTEAFKICYCVNGIELTVEKSTTQALKVSLSEALKGYLGHDASAIINIEARLRQQYPFLVGKSVFVPASRSFYATIQQNMFALMSANISIDPMLSRFGQFYEGIKRHFNGFDDPNISQLVEQILKGKYQYDCLQDWIVASDKKVNIANASSGQQEALPLLMTVAHVAADTSGRMNTLYIEEPEAHLFPVAQSQVLSLLAMVYNSQRRVFITTHSPYILSALNNLIMACDKIAEGKLSHQTLVQINGPCEPIAYDDVSAYTLVDGKSVSIKDDQYRMVGGDILDSISDHFEAVVNRLLAE